MGNYFAGFTHIELQMKLYMPETNNIRCTKSKKIGITGG